MAFSNLYTGLLKAANLPGGKCCATVRLHLLQRKSIILPRSPTTHIKQFHSLVNPPPQRYSPRAERTAYAKYWASVEKNKSRRTTPPRTAKTHVNWNRMKCFVQFITTPTADTPGTTLLLHFDNKRYLIGNIGEGTQRAAVQRKLALLKVKDIFLTGQVGWAGCGGLLGMILTVADSLASSREGRTESSKGGRGKEADDEREKDSLTLHGGRNLTHLIATARRFVFRKGVPLRVNEFRKEESTREQNGVIEPTWKDENLLVWSMVVEPEVAAQTEIVTGRSRKRSHEEFVNENAMGLANGEGETPEEREQRYDNMRKAVVGSMFDSDWKLDALFKKKLSEVGKNEGVIFVRNEQGHIEEYTGKLMQDDPSVQDREVLMRNPWPGAKIETLPPTTPSHSSVCYIFKNYPQRGKFDPKKAQALKVPKGPSYRQLTQGESVVSEDGVTITPDMVLGKEVEGNGFAVIELPSTLHVAPLLTREELASKEVMSGVQSIIWILGEGVLEDSRLQKFMKDRPTLQHYVSSKDCCANHLALESAASSAIRLHLLDPGRFPIPKYNNEISSPVDAKASFAPARPGLSLGLQPTYKADKSQIVPVLDTKKVVLEASAEVQKLADTAREKITTEAFLQQIAINQEDIPSKDAEITALGTGSALPSKYRNVSATLVRVPGYGSYLLDCGENTIGQLRRVFGEELPEILCDLKAIWISHLHADHHLGTASVIREWAKETAKHEATKENTLVVASDEAMLHWLREFSEVEDFGYSRVHPISMGRATTFNYRFSAADTAKYGLTSIQTCYVLHCHGAMAVVLTLPNGFKVAYSGDCRPNEHFAKIGQGATLLIHEATFDDELQGDAKAKKHSTTSEALHIGKLMGARRILLTHFSQRYQKLPVMDSEGGKEQVAIVAFDYMKIKLGDFVLQEAFKPALMELFKEEE